MGKRIITRRRGRGTMTYRAPSHRYAGEIKHRPIDDAEKTGVVYGKVVDLIHSVGHSAPLAKIKYVNHEVLTAAPVGIRVNDVLASGVDAPVSNGNTLPLKKIPDGTLVYNLEINPGDGGKLVKAPGSYANIVAKEGEFVYIKLPSRETMIISNECRAQLGVISGGGRLEKPLMKAGNQSYKKLARHRYWPTNRGVHQSAYTHPHGGKQHHVGKSTVVARSTPPGGKVGHIAARSTGRKKSKKATEAGGES